MGSWCAPEGAAFGYAVRSAIAVLFLMQRGSRALRTVMVTLAFAGAALGAPSDVRAQSAKDEYLDAANPHTDIARLWSARRGIDFAVLFTETTGYNQAADLTRLDALIAHVVAAHGYDASKVVLGGFSAGGYAAFRWVLRKLRGDALAILPAALISVDAPLDIGRWYRGMNLLVQRTDDQNPFHGESQYLTQLYREMLGGTPDEQPAAYRDQSILTASLPDGGNAVYFRRMPMRLYSEPDMAFFVPNGLDYGGINASDQVSIAARLDN